METLRRPFQGVTQIIRFNWHFYALAFIAIGAGFLLAAGFDGWLGYVLTGFAMMAGLVILVSLVASYYVYDCSGLYQFAWLPEELTAKGRVVAHIHAGFDEASVIIQAKLSPRTLHVLDFYDQEKHTELSIRRARKAFPPYPGTVPLRTVYIPLADQSVDLIFLFLSAHEIRSHSERLLFFGELHRVLKVGGCIVLTEHLRDWRNFLAYNIGFFHFHSGRTWIDLIRSTRFRLSGQKRVTPFITTFIVEKDD